MPKHHKGRRELHFWQWFKPRHDYLQVFISVITILISEFSELINTTPLAGAAKGTSPIRGNLSMHTK